MNKVIVVTDSVANPPQELVDKYGIYIIPVRVTFEGKVYRDTSDDLPLELVHKFEKQPQLDTTPWPPTVYCEAYKEVGRKAKKSGACSWCLSSYFNDIIG
jgi:fatty acid-binding protein DegV